MLMNYGTVSNDTVGLLDESSRSIFRDPFFLILVGRPFFCDLSSCRTINPSVALYDMQYRRYLVYLGDTKQRRINKRVDIP
jgi:hypothetical protein